MICRNQLGRFTGGFLIALSLMQADIVDSSSTLIPHHATRIVFGGVEIISQPEKPVRFYTSLTDMYCGLCFNDSSYRSLSDRLLAIPIDSGYYFPILSLETVQLRQNADTLFLNLVFNLKWGERVRVDTVIFDGIRQSAPRILNRIARALLVGQLYHPSAVAQFIHQLQLFPFLESAGASEIIRTQSGGYGVLFPLIEKPANFFTGIAGYVPPVAGRPGFFSGEIDLRLMNMGGQGRQLLLYWSKINRYSQKIRLSVYEPSLPGLAGYGKAEFGQELRDTLLVIRNLRLAGGQDFRPPVSWSYQFRLEQTIPTPAGQNQLGLKRSQITWIGGGFGWDRRNHRWHPTSGWSMDGGIHWGYQKNVATTFRGRFETLFSGEGLLPLSSASVAAVNFQFKGRWGQKRSLTLADHFYFGGAKTLRGYPTDFFHGDRIAWSNIEWRWLYGKMNRFMVFYDIGYFRFDHPTPTADFPAAWGVGVRLNSRAGLLGVDYGFGRGDTFSSAKIHLFLENQF